MANTPVEPLKIAIERMGLRFRSAHNGAQPVTKLGERGGAFAGGCAGIRGISGARWRTLAAAHAVRARIGLARKLQSEGMSIVLVEHDMPPVMTCVDSLVVRDRGRVLAEAYLGKGACTC